MSKSILIVGATGKQGGATLRALAASADPTTRLLAVTRDATSASAKKLVAKYPKQVTLVQGNLDDSEALFVAAEKALSSSSTTNSKIWGVFSVQLPEFNKAGAATEERQGEGLIDAALRHGVSHFVYSSVDRSGPELSPRNPTDVPHFATKHNIEQHLINSVAASDQEKKKKNSSDGSNEDETMTYTILRPVAFYENLGGFQGKVFATAWRDVVVSRPLQIIGTEDIGRVAARALLPENRARFAGRAISLAGDELTIDQFNQVFVDKTGHPAPTTFGFMARFVLWMVAELGIMYRWFDREGYGASLEESREVLPEIMDFATWLEDQKARKLL